MLWFYTYLHSSWHKQFFTYLIATWAITSCYHINYFKRSSQFLRDYAVIKALHSLYWDYKNYECFTHVSWIVVGSLWPITEPSWMEFTAYDVFFTMQWRLWFLTQSYSSSVNWIYYIQLGFRILVLPRKMKISQLLLALPLEGLLLQRAGQARLKQAQQGFLCWLSTARGAAKPLTTPHWEAWDRWKTNTKGKTISRPTSPLHISQCCGEQLFSYNSLPLNAFTCKRHLWVHLPCKLLQGCLWYPATSQALNT